MRTIAQRSPLSPAEEIRHLLSVFAGAYGDIFFIQNIWFGTLVLLCTFLVPDIGVHGFLAGLCALALIRAVNAALPDSLFARIAVCNSVLMGLYFGALFKLTPAGLLVLFTATAAILLVTNLVMNVFAYRHLPALSLPFSLVGFVTFWWVKSMGTLIQFKPYLFHESVLGAAFPGGAAFASVGKILSNIIFMPGAYAGAAILVFLLFYSRLQFFLVCYGLFLAVISQVVFYPFLPGPVHYATPFNIVLTSIALGGIFLPFSRASVAIATVGVFFAVAIEGAFLRFFSYTPDISPMTFPFCLTMILLLDFIRTHRPQWCPAEISRNIETTADLHHSRRERFGETTPVLGLPILQEAAVMQGIDGEWTHIGAWRFALDFHITDPLGKPCRLDETGVENYYIFGTQVVAPCDGEIARVEDGHPDQKIGLIDLEYNWGNYVMIRTPAGHYVLLAHLKQNSIAVKLGSWVYEGQPLAMAGNSGHSYEPHLHLQMQKNAILGAPTIPFRFKSYQSNRIISFFNVPRKGVKVSPFPFNKTLPYSLALKLGQELHFVMETAGKKVNVSIKVRLDEQTGRWFFEDEKKGRLSFWSDPRIFYVYDLQCAEESPLNMLMAALPLLPLTFGHEYSWKDCLPLGVTNRGVRRAILELLNPFFESLSRSRAADYKLDPTGMTLSGRVLFFNERVETVASLDPLVGIREVRVGQLKLTRGNVDFPVFPSDAAERGAGGKQ